MGKQSAEATRQSRPTWETLEDWMRGQVQALIERVLLERLGLLTGLENMTGLRLAQPLAYLDMLTLNRHTRMIITDSGGLQEEATVLGVPCVTLRHNTERPVTIEAGANQVVGNEPARIRSAIFTLLNGHRPKIHMPNLWDGKASLRIAQVLTHLHADGWFPQA